MVPSSRYTALTTRNQPKGTGPRITRHRRYGNDHGKHHHDYQPDRFTLLIYPGQVGSLEDFKRFKEGYECTSSPLGSMETVPAGGRSGEVTLMKQENITPVGTLGALTVTPNQTASFARNNEEGAEHELVDIGIQMLPTEHRFGFSVMGGRDEGFHPRIDDISRGSPADRADLEVGDEIVEVNGQSLANSTHAEVIQHIHQCIRSKSISLRVKRPRNRQPVSVPSEHIQNAYIVAVEEDAKRRLEELVYNRKLTPIDMTHNLSGYISDDPLNSSNSIVNVSVEHNPMYQHSSMPFNTQGQPMTNGHVEMSEMNGYKEKDTPRKGKGDKQKKRQRPVSNTETPLIDSLLTDNNVGHSQNSIDTDDSRSDSFLQSSVDMDDGPHREMAIDVPEDFHGSIKTPPRLPGSNHSGSSSPRSRQSTPFKSADNARNVGRSANTAPVPSEEQIERIHKHQQEIRKRREEEERRAKEEEFLRASLRGSKKMRALEQRAPQAGVVNTAFIENDDESGGFEEGYVSGRQTQTGRDYMKKNLSLEDVYTSLNHMQGKVHSADGKEKLKYLMNLFSNQQFQHAVGVHHKLLEVKTRDPPVASTCQNSQDLHQECLDSLQFSQHPQSAELANILNKQHFRGLLQAHDRIAVQESRPPPEQPPEEFPFNYSSPGDSIKIVHLEKTSEPLGATVKNEGESVIISRIVKGGTADKSGLLHEGDEILEINGTDMKGKDVNDVSEMLADMSGTITFVIYPTTEFIPPPSPRKEVMHLKAMFNYDPEEDPYIPCRELGISFLKGDILHVINMEDANWWQAYREGEEEYNTLAGLIPSKSFQEQREALRVTLGDENKENQKKGRSCACGRSNKKKRKKNLQKGQMGGEQDEVLTYEEVALYYPEPNRRRPIVLIGPQNVGRHELRHRLMESDFDRFAAAVPHTSRPLKQVDPSRPDEEVEMDGKDYHFVPRAIFQADIVSGKFIEHGEYEKNLYGTSVEAVRNVISLGKICVLNLDPEALYILKNTDLKPYVVFVYPPNMEKLRQIQQRFGMTDIQEEELKDVIEKAREMEDKFGHFFDFILVNTDMDKAYDELLAEINRIEVEPQWVPRLWLR